MHPPNSTRIVGIALRLSLAAAFLSAVADRFGWWEPFGQSSWGSMGAFADYTHQLVPFAHGWLLTVIVWAATATEVILGALLLTGWRPKLVGAASCLVLITFGTAMAISLGIASPLGYSVFSAASAAAAYAILGTSSPSHTSGSTHQSNAIPESSGKANRGGTAGAAAGHDAEYQRAHRWRDATRELVLVRAAAVAVTDLPQSSGSISITLTGKTLSEDLLLADTGDIALTSVGDRVDARSFPMTVIPMRLDTLSDPPAVRVLGQGVTEPTVVRLVVELTARNPQTDTTSVIACEYGSVRLDAQTPLALIDFHLQHGELRH